MREPKDGIISANHDAASVQCGTGFRLVPEKYGFGPTFTELASLLTLVALNRQLASKLGVTCGNNEMNLDEEPLNVES